MASGEARRVSCEDIQLVQNLIERCLQLYMSQREAVDVLLQQAKIEPAFTELIWQKLEEENQDFFRAYHLRLLVKDQILRFNELLERQDLLMHQLCSSEFSSLDISNGSQIPSMQQNTLPHSLEHVDVPLKMETADRDFNANLHNAYIAVPPLQQCTLAMDLAASTGRLEAPSSVPFSQSSNVRMIQGMTGEMLRPEGIYTGNTGVVFSTDGNAMDARPTIGDAPISSYSAVVPDSQPLNRSFLDAETPAFGPLSRNSSLPYLTSEFSNTAEILESYPGPIFVGSDHEDFLYPHGRGEHQGPIAPS